MVRDGCNRVSSSYSHAWVLWSWKVEGAHALRRRRTHAVGHRVVVLWRWLQRVVEVEQGQRCLRRVCVRVLALLVLLLLLLKSGKLVELVVRGGWVCLVELLVGL